MMMEAYPMWAELEKESNTELYKKTGLLMISLDEKGSLYHDSLVQMRKYGRAHHKILDQEAVRREYPELDLPPGALVFMEYEGGTLRAERAVRAFQTQFVQRGGTLLDGQKVLEINPGTTVTVKTNRGEFRGRSIVLTPGAWAQKVLRPLGLDPPLEVWRINVPYWKEKVDGGMAKFPNFIAEMPGGKLMYGLQSLEYPGLTKFAYHGGSDQVDPDYRDLVPAGKKKEVELLKSVVAKIFPRLESEPTIMETCMYTDTPDDKLIIDRHPLYSNISICCGCSGHAFKLSPSIGKILCRLAMGKEPHIDIRPLSFKRFKNSCLSTTSKM